MCFLSETFSLEKYAACLYLVVFAGRSYYIVSNISRGGKKIFIKVWARICRMLWDCFGI